MPTRMGRWSKRRSPTRHSLGRTRQPGGADPAGRIARLRAHGVTGTSKEITGALAAGQNGRLPLLPPTPTAAQIIPNGCRLAAQHLEPPHAIRRHPRERATPGTRPSTSSRLTPSVVTRASEARPSPLPPRPTAARSPSPPPPPHTLPL